MVDNVQEHTRCAPFRCRCEPSRARGRHQLSRTLPQVQTWDQPIRARPRRPELGMALWLVAVACGLWLACDLWLWPVAWGCAYGCSPECSQKQCSRLRETIVSYKTYRLVYAERSYSNWVLTGWRPLLAPHGCPPGTPWVPQVFPG